MFVTLPPGPTSPALVQTLRWALRPLAFLRECERRYGDTFSVRLLGFKQPIVIVSEPRAVKALFSEPAHGVPQIRNVSLEPIMGPRSLLLLEGDDHLAYRRLMLPPFHGGRMRSYESIVKETVDAEIDSWPLGEEFAVHPRMQAVTLEIILRVVFGIADASRRARLRASLIEILASMSSPWAQASIAVSARLGRALGPWRRLEAKLREVDKQIYAEIEACRSDPGFGQRNDILAALLQARFEDGAPMSDAEVRDQLMTLLMAGHETSATALSWTLDMVLRHPPALQRLRDSLAAGEEDYLQATITESLRTRPLVPFASRKLNKDLVVDNLRLPAGTDLTPAIWLTHTRADVYPEPFAFRPERFLEEGPDTYAWIPFGGGIRRCLGAAFAEFEMRIALREILTRCELHKADPAPEAVVRTGPTLAPRKGTRIVVTERAAATDPELAAA